MVRCKNKQFSRTYLYIADFIQVQKIAGQRLFYEFKTLYEPSVNENEEGEEGGIETCAIDASSCKACEINLRHAGKLEYSCCCITVSCANVGECVIRTRHLNLRIFAFTQLNITRTQAQVTCCWIDSCGSIKVRLTQQNKYGQKGQSKTSVATITSLNLLRR